MDIEELGRHFLQKYSVQLGKQLQNISPDLIDFFWKHSWPGNVRELQHVIESAVNMVQGNEATLTLDHCYFANILGISDHSDCSGVMPDSNREISDIPSDGIKTSIAHLSKFKPNPTQPGSASVSVPISTPGFVSGPTPIPSAYEKKRQSAPHASDASVSMTPLSETKLVLEKNEYSGCPGTKYGKHCHGSQGTGMSRQLLGYKIKKLGLRSELNRIKVKYL